MSPLSRGPALLFCPGDRPERFAKAAARADAVIIDLEDAVSSDAKGAARGALIDAEVDAARTIVRVNPVGSDDFVADIATLSQTDVRTIMVAKAESPTEIDGIDPRFSVIALCETPRGILAAEELSRLDRVVGLMWGAEDLVAGLGGTSSRHPDGTYRDVVRAARARVLLAAGAAGKAAIDAIHVDIADTAGLAAEAEDAAASGFRATACIHPSQVDVIRAAYRPDESTLAWARGVLDAATSERGVFRHDGRMVDEPVLRHARLVLSRAGAGG